MSALPVLALHAGLQKTGSSSLQVRLLGPSGPLARAGWDTLPAAAAPWRAHHNAGLEARGGRRHRPDLPGLAALAAAARAVPRAFASSEEFGLVPPPALPRLREALAGVEVRPILVLRNPLDFAESVHAQACKTRPRAGFAEQLALIEYAGRLAFDAVADAWGHAFGEASLSLLAYEDHPDTVAPVLRLLGLAPGAPETARRSNASLNERFVAASQRLLHRAAAGEIAGFEGDAGVARLGRLLGAAGARDPRFRGRPVFLGRREAAAFVARMRPMAEALSRRLPLPAPWWEPDPARREPEPAGPEDEAALLEGIAAAR